MKRSTDLVFISHESMKSKEAGRPYIVWEDTAGFEPPQYEPIEMEINFLNQCEMVLDKYEQTGFIIIPNR